MSYVNVGCGLKQLMMKGGLMQKIDSVLTGLCDKRHMYSGIGLSQ